jgi:phosphoadenosine phosphosulfate reductase
MLSPGAVASAVQYDQALQSASPAEVIAAALDVVGPR